MGNLEINCDHELSGFLASTRGGRQIQLVRSVNSALKTGKFYSGKLANFIGESNELFLGRPANSTWGGQLIISWETGKFHSEKMTNSTLETGEFHLGKPANSTLGNWSILPREISEFHPGNREISPRKLANSTQGNL